MRAVYRDGFRNKTITAVVRPDDRSSPDHFGFIPSLIDIPVRFIRNVGERVVGAKADLWPDDGTTIIRTDCIVRRISDLTSEDLEGCSPDCATAELVRYHLGLVYNQPLPNIDEMVTIWRFKYK